MSHNGPPARARDQQTAHPNLLGAAPPPFLSLIATNFFLGTGSLTCRLSILAPRAPDAFIFYIKFSVESLFPIDFCSVATAHSHGRGSAHNHSGAAPGNR